MSKFLLSFFEFLKLPEGRPIPFFGKYWRRFILFCQNKLIRKVKLPKEPLNSKERKEKVIASLTSFPARINCVEYAVKSLMLQSYKPDRIVLWLAKGQFEGVELSKGLLDLQEKGLEIKWCDEDLRGHKKYFYSIQEQKPDELVVTFDDDLIYPSNCIKRLIKHHKRFPSAIIDNRGYEITFDKNGELNPHKKWKIMSRYAVKRPGALFQLSTGVGCLYPYGVLHKDVCKADLIKKHALSIDDLWMSVMAILVDTKFVKTHYATKILTTVSNSQEFQLGVENMRNPERIDKHDTCISSLMEEYPKLKEKLSISNK